MAIRPRSAAGTCRWRRHRPERAPVIGERGPKKRFWRQQPQRAPAARIGKAISPTNSAPARRRRLGGGEGRPQRQASPYGHPGNAPSFRPCRWRRLPLRHARRPEARAARVRWPAAWRPTSRRRRQLGGCPFNANGPRGPRVRGTAARVAAVWPPGRRSPRRAARQTGSSAQFHSRFTSATPFLTHPPTHRRHAAGMRTQWM